MKSRISAICVYSTQLAARATRGSVPFLCFAAHDPFVSTFNSFPISTNFDSNHSSKGHSLKKMNYTTDIYLIGESGKVTVRLRAAQQTRGDLLAVSLISFHFHILINQYQPYHHPVFSKSSVLSLKSWSYQI